MDALLTHDTGWALLLGFYVPRVLETLKRASWFPLLSMTATRLNRIVAIGVSVVVAAGLTWHFTDTAEGWSLVVGAPTSLPAFLLAVVRQFSVQQFFYEHQQQAG